MTYDEGSSTESDCSELCDAPHSEALATPLRSAPAPSSGPDAPAPASLASPTSTAESSSINILDFQAVLQAHGAVPAPASFAPVLPVAVASDPTPAAASVQPPQPAESGPIATAPRRIPLAERVREMREHRQAHSPVSIPSRLHVSPENCASCRAKLVFASSARETPPDLIWRCACCQQYLARESFGKKQFKKGRVGGPRCRDCALMDHKVEATRKHKQRVEQQQKQQQKTQRKLKRMEESMKQHPVPLSLDEPRPLRAAAIKARGVWATGGGVHVTLKTRSKKSVRRNLAASSSSRMQHQQANERPAKRLKVSRSFAGTTKS